VVEDEDYKSLLDQLRVPRNRIDAGERVPLHRNRPNPILMGIVAQELFIVENDESLASTLDNLNILPQDGGGWSSKAKKQK
jgi:hypothetical protein